MGQAFRLGPIARIDDNIVHLGPPGSRAQDYECQVLHQLAGYSAALAVLMGQLASEIAELNEQGDLSEYLENIVTPTATFWRTCERISAALDGGAA